MLRWIPIRMLVTRMLVARMLLLIVMPAGTHMLGVTPMMQIQRRPRTQIWVQTRLVTPCWCCQFDRMPRIAIPRTQIIYIYIYGFNLFRDMANSNTEEGW